LPLPVLSFWGSGGASVAAAPGGFPASVAGGATATLIWTVTAGAPGAVGFSLTVTGADGNAGTPLAVLALSPSTVTVFPAPALVVTAVTAAPASVEVGSSITVTLTVGNPGSLSATSVVPLVAVTGTGRADLAGGPFPAGVAALAAGGTASFTFTFRAAGAGTVTFTARATAGNAPASAAATSAPVTILAVVTAGGKPSDVVVGPHPFTPARGGTMTFSRIPAGSTVRIFTIAGEPVVRVRADGLGTAAWNGRNDGGSVVLPAVYLFVVEAPDGRRHTGKLQVDR
jgi:hypothetical protein